MFQIEESDFVSLNYMQTRAGDLLLMLLPVAVNATYKLAQKRQAYVDNNLMEEFNILKWSEIALRYVTSMCKLLLEQLVSSLQMCIFSLSFILFTDNSFAIWLEGKV